ncbi:Bifunctional solanapyrone synthase [Apiospora saccharicola]|uniref:Bifunctional solanapyrone synthase n=1 Tax=Apiospora saccharicola TaxID=335842 RepID=A0ABR1UXE0_9PEZI
MDQNRDTIIAKLRESGLDDVLYQPGDDKYDTRVASYWSLSPRLHPWAFVQPWDTDEVSKAVKAIVTTEYVKFALRGGDHTCYAGSNNIESGVTIDLSLLTKTSYNADTGIAHVLPGTRWTDVYDHEGREGLVGVGGFTSFIKNPVTRGGNMLGLENVTEDSVLLVMDIMVPDKEQEIASFLFVQAAIKDMEDYTKSIDGAVAFRYLSYCNGTENIKKMKDAAAKYDRTGVFQTRMPEGFKISKVKS